MSAMSTTTATRPSPPVAAWAGIGFFVFFVAGAIFAFSAPDTNDSDAEWHDWYSKSGNRIGILIGLYLLVISAVLFLVFAAGLVERVRAGMDDASIARRIAVVTPAIVATLIMVGAVNIAGIAGNVSFGGERVPKDADFMRHTLGYAMIFVPGAITAAVFITAAALAARATGFFPNWFTVLSYVFAALLLVAVIFFPMAALPIWVLIASILLLRAPARVAANPSP